MTGPFDAPVLPEVPVCWPRDDFSDGLEAYMGTDPARACPASALPHDEAVDAWPPDFNDDRFVDIFDISQVSGRFGTGIGDPNYAPRFDLNADGFIDIYDLSQVSGRFGETCAPGP